MSFFNSIPLWGWFDIGFNIIVLVSLAGEQDVVAKWLFREKCNDLVPPESLRKNWKRGCEIALIVGIAGEILCLPFSIYGTANAERDAARAKAAVTTNEVEVAELSVLTSSNELETAKIKQVMAQNDTSKMPVTSTTAEIKLRFANSPLMDSNLEFSVHLYFSDKDFTDFVPWKMWRYPRGSVISMDSDSVRRTPGSPVVYTASFSSAYAENFLLFTLPAIRVSAQEAGEKYSSLCVELTNFPVQNASVMGGTAKLLFNSRVQRRFNLTSTQVENGYALIFGTWNPVTSPVTIFNGQ